MRYLQIGIKPPRNRGGFHFRLLFYDSIVGARVNASAAFGANVLVDFVDIAFFDSFVGAFVQASAASYAFVSDFVHSGTPP